MGWLLASTLACEPTGLPSCNTDAACQPHQRCIRGVCQETATATAPCQSAADCSSGQRCEGGRCKPSAAATTVCSPNQQRCTNNTLQRCKPDGSGWVSTSCGPHHTCQRDACVRKPLAASCGNGAVEENEQCDDGNNVSGDGCSRYCLRERVMLFEPPAPPRDLAPFVLGSRVCRSAQKRQSYQANATPLYVSIVPTVCKLNDRPVVAEATVQSHIAFLNRVFANAKIVFVMDPIRWETDRDHCEVFYDTESTATLRRYSQATKIAVYYARNIHGGSFSIGGYANLSGVVVNASAFGMSELLAHELGHSFGLDHPHACYHGRETARTCSSAGDQLCDTPPDPGPKGVNGLDHCPDGKRKDGQCTVRGCRSISCPGGEKPHFRNLMSYYHCGTNLTPDQLLTIRCVAFNEQARRVQTRRPCRSHSDCPSPATCNNGGCEEPPGCQGHSDCPPRYACTQQRCVALPAGSCRLDRDCAGGQVCHSSRCQSPPECYKDDDCPAGQICQQGACKPAPLPECQRHSDCPPRHSCEAGTCKSLPSGACRANSDCSSGQICQNQRCIHRPPPPCRSASDCPANHLCRNQQCVACIPDGQRASSDTGCCSQERNDRSVCCTGRSCCGSPNHSHTNANGQCVCDEGYEWLNQNASRDFRCQRKQAPICKKDGESASSDADCCSKERNDQGVCCQGKACCGPQNHSQTRSNGNCQCLSGYTWVDPSDQLNFLCQRNTPTCTADGKAAAQASDCCSKTRDERGLCCTGKSCCGQTNGSESDGQGGCRCKAGHVRQTPNDPNDWRCTPSQGCPHCCTSHKTLQGHTQIVRGVAWSPDGKTVASASYDKTVRLWDAQTGRLQQTLTGFGNAVMAVAYHPNGTELAAGGYDHTFRKWRASGQSIGSTRLFAPVRAVAYRPDGAQLVTGTEKGAYVWSLAGGSGNGFGSSYYIRGLAYSPNNQWLAVATRNQAVHLYQTRNNQRLRSFTGHNSHVFSVAFHPQGNLLASSSATIKLWNPSTGALVRTLNGHNRGIYKVLFHPKTGTLFSAGEDGTIKLWDASTGQLLQTLQGHTGPVYTLALTPDGKHLASGSKDNTVRLWNCP